MEMTCIVCPNGCSMTVERNGEEIIVTGNRCKRGEAFAKAELTQPMRTICSTVKTVFPDVPVLPVRTSCEIPKDKIFAVMEEINKVTVTERIHSSDIIIHNVLNLNADIIATSRMLQDQKERQKEYE